MDKSTGNDHAVHQRFLTISTFKHIVVFSTSLLCWDWFSTGLPMFWSWKCFTWVQWRVQKNSDENGKRTKRTRTDSTRRKNEITQGLFVIFRFLEDLLIYFAWNYTHSYCTRSKCKKTPKDKSVGENRRKLSPCLPINVSRFLQWTKS